MEPISWIMTKKTQRPMMSDIWIEDMSYRAKTTAATPSREFWKRTPLMYVY